MASASQQHDGPVSVLMNNAGTMGGDDALSNPEGWQRILGVNAFTEGLAHTLREKTGGRVTAHLLIPGFAHTGMIARFVPNKPDSAWTPEQVVDFMLGSIARNDFYILCPDNETTREQDERRILWTANDLIENRPALSRWHPDYAAAFRTFMDG